MSNKCLVCNSENLKEVFSQKRVPIAVNAPLDESNFDCDILGDLEIVQCLHCSLIYNKAFQPLMIEKIYTHNFSSSLTISQKELDRLKEIIDGTILKENIENHCVIEIGAGDFTFSKLLIDRGASKVIAFEPSDLFQTENPRLYHVNDFFSPEKIPVGIEEIDLIVMRHVLEHLPDPLNTIAQLASIARLGLKLYIEVPNAEDILEKKRFYDFFYEHVTYFNPDLLTRLLKSFGFTTRRITALFDGQHFGLLCEKTEVTLPHPLPIQPLETLPSIEGFKVYTENFLKKLQEVINSYDRAAIYGAGAHGVQLAALLDLASNRVKYFLDRSQLKAGKYSRKTHIPIVIPQKENLQELEAIIIIAPLHQDAIASDLRGKLAFTKDIWGTYPDVFKIF